MFNLQAEILQKRPESVLFTDVWMDGWDGRNIKSVFKDIHTFLVYR